MTTTAPTTTALTVRVYQEPMTAMLLDTALAMPTHLWGTAARIDWIEGYLDAVYGTGHHDTTDHVLDGCDQLAELLSHGKRRDRIIDNVTSKQMAHTFGIAPTQRIPAWSIDE